MKKTIYFFVIISLLFTACKKDEKSNNFTINGDVTNLVNRVVRQGTVNLMSGSSVAYTAAISSDGKYALSDVPKGSYALMVESDGYLTFTKTVDVSKDTTVNTSLTGKSTISGLIINSQTGTGLAGAVVAFSRAGLKSGNGIAADTSLINAEFVITADLYGQIEMVGVPSGVFDIVIRSAGFTTRLIKNTTITTGEFYLPQVTLVEKVAEGSLRIILNWGEFPRDLDSHLTGPMADGSRFHMYYVNKEPTGSLVNLDVDDVTSYGPETTTIETIRNGLYRFSIFNYSEQSSNGGSGIFTSPTTVEIYDSEGLLRTYTAPAFNADEGNTWRVFEVNVTNGNYVINDLNVYLNFNDDLITKNHSGGIKPPMNFRAGDF